jgi:hypothetical protein
MFMRKLLKVCISICFISNNITYADTLRPLPVARSAAAKRQIRASLHKGASSVHSTALKSSSTGSGNITSADNTSLANRVIYDYVDVLVWYMNELVIEGVTKSRAMRETIAELEKKRESLALAVTSYAIISNSPRVLEYCGNPSRWSVYVFRKLEKKFFALAKARQIEGGREKIHRLIVEEAQAIVSVIRKIPRRKTSKLSISPDHVRAIIDDMFTRPGPHPSHPPLLDGAAPSRQDLKSSPAGGVDSAPIFLNIGDSNVKLYVAIRGSLSQRGFTETYFSPETNAATLERDIIAAKETVTLASYDFLISVDTPSHALNLQLAFYPNTTSLSRYSQAKIPHKRSFTYKQERRPLIGIGTDTEGKLCLVLTKKFYHWLWKATKGERYPEWKWAQPGEMRLMSIRLIKEGAKKRLANVNMIVVIGRPQVAVSGAMPSKASSAGTEADEGLSPEDLMPTGCSFYYHERYIVEVMLSDTDIKRITSPTLGAVSLIWNILVKDTDQANQVVAELQLQTRLNEKGEVCGYQLEKKAKDVLTSTNATTAVERLITSLERKLSELKSRNIYFTKIIPEIQAIGISQPPAKKKSSSAGTLIDGSGNAGRCDCDRLPKLQQQILAISAAA